MSEEAASVPAMNSLIHRFFSRSGNRVQLLENDILSGTGAAGIHEGGGEQGGDDGVSGDLSHWSLSISDSVPCCMPPRVPESIVWFLFNATENSDEFARYGKYAFF